MTEFGPNRALVGHPACCSAAEHKRHSPRQQSRELDEPAFCGRSGHSAPSDQARWSAPSQISNNFCWMPKLAQDGPILWALQTTVCKGQKLPPRLRAAALGNLNPPQTEVP